MKDLGRKRGQRQVIVTFHIGGPMGMVILDSEKFPLVKVHLMLYFQSSTMIGSLTLSFTEEMVVDLLCLLVLGVERNMTVNALLVHMIVLVEVYPDIVSGMLKVFHLRAYDLFNPGGTFSLVMPYVVRRFDVSPYVLLGPIFISTSIGESIVAKRVYRNGMVSLSHRFTDVIL
ncbi:hypothetical protein MTR67_034815 [Solanum verrucosum]|uniref:Uncharacterized protein n=1 Tax=Solanum verrucosum TaxID=315347 RepID=A0AAF0U929_SOLVR|nr:hypothetical protein MTR67_034815 [Solanum verrucosum]